MTTNDILNRITKARVWAMSSINPDVVFYGGAGCALADVLDDSVETACTDGRVIKWGPDFVRGLYKDGVVRGDLRLRFVFLHEVLHCAHLHFWRLPLTAEGNRAGDYVINRILRDVPDIEPLNGCLDDRKFDGMAEEEVLAALRKDCRSPQPQPGQPKPGQPKPGDGQPQPGGPQPGKGHGRPDGDSDGNGAPQDDDPGTGVDQDTPGDGKAGKSNGKGPQRPADTGGCGGFEAPAEDKPAGKAAGSKPGSAADEAGRAETLRQEWERNVMQAAQAAQSLARGNLPAAAKRLVDRIAVAARPDWRAETAEFVRSAISSVPDWSRQSRRMATAPVIYPRQRRDDLGTVVFVRDTSGSIVTSTVAAFNAHVAAIIADTGCSAVILDADAAVQAEHRLSPGDEVPVRAEGGGGTDFRPAFERVAELVAEGERIAGVVYLTDLIGMHPAEAPQVPVLWACTTKLTAPSGRTVRIAEV
jgi:predicted metal-dependent peptidase